jgi:prepilin-type N-terminal cleavage/methylation domain-containing protein
VSPWNLKIDGSSTGYRRNKDMPSSQRAFTLIELLTAIGIVALLGAVAIPVVNTSREKARKVDAVNQIRQIGIATRLYVAENDGRLPGSQHTGNSWVAGLMPYLGLDATNPDVDATMIDHPSCATPVVMVMPHLKIS